MNGNTKEVRFDKWCPSCIHYKKDESEDPCWDCLTQDWKIDSTKPIMWEGGLDEAIKSQTSQTRS